MDAVFELLAKFLAVLVVLPLHEFAHALIAYAAGDPTAKWSGRLTLNPFKHFDIFGLVAFIFAGFGWAKPVPINPNNFKHRRWGIFATSIAGITANLMFAFAIYPIWYLVAVYVLPLIQGSLLATFLSALFTYLFVFSLNFAVFNLIPLAPLDGFRVVTAFNKKRGKVYCFFEKYGQFILLGFILINVVSSYIPILGYVDLLGFTIGKLVSVCWDGIAAAWGVILRF